MKYFDELKKACSKIIEDDSYSKELVEELKNTYNLKLEQKYLELCEFAEGLSANMPHCLDVYFKYSNFCSLTIRFLNNILSWSCIDSELNKHEVRFEKDRKFITTLTSDKNIQFYYEELLSNWEDYFITGAAKGMEKSFIQVCIDRVNEYADLKREEKFKNEKTIKNLQDEINKLNCSIHTKAWKDML